MSGFFHVTHHLDGSARSKSLDRPSVIALYVGLFSCDWRHCRRGHGPSQRLGASGAVIALYVGLFSCDGS